MKYPFQHEEPGRDECLKMTRLCLSANLRKTERLITRHYDAYLADAGVTAVQLPILAIIAAEEGPTFRLLARELGLDRSTLSRNLALLERVGFVVIGPSSGPKPGLLSLTEKGHETLRRGHDRWLEAHEQLERILDSNAIEHGLLFLATLRGSARTAAGTEERTERCDQIDAAVATN
jgi:DNA-binding MarR family transcriptional regulator